jgi:hypothetical protein
MSISRCARIPPSPPSILDSAEVLQKQAFLEPPENDGVAPRCSTGWVWHRGRVTLPSLKRRRESESLKTQRRSRRLRHERQVDHGARPRRNLRRASPDANPVGAAAQLRRRARGRAGRRDPASSRAPRTREWRRLPAGLRSPTRAASVSPVAFPRHLPGRILASPCPFRAVSTELGFEIAVAGTCPPVPPKCGKWLRSQR